MTVDEIAKNLLAGKTCDSCGWSNSFDKRIYTISDKSKGVKILLCEFSNIYKKFVDGNDTCVLWEPWKSGYGRK